MLRGHSASRCGVAVMLDGRAFMKVLYFDCASGISGDMAVSALVDLGVPQDVLKETVAALRLEGVSLEWSRVKKCGIEGLSLRVEEQGGRGGAHGSYQPVSEHTHESETHHSHGHEEHHIHTHPHAHAAAHHAHGKDAMGPEPHTHAPHRTFRDIRELLETSALPKAVREKALGVFEIIAEVEGKIHGQNPEDVHFHEVGATDSLVDIVGFMAALHYLQPDRVVFSRVKEGCGVVNCAHGRLPVPVPATLGILRHCGAYVDFTDTPGEMVTPTGAGLMAAVGDEYGSLCPSGRIEAIGYGAGERDYAHPNILRALWVDTNETAQHDQICVLETAMDDITGEELGYCLEMIMEAEALDCYLTPIAMKKNRPGHLLTVLCRLEDEGKLVEILLKNTPTLGLRRRVEHRHVMQRTMEKRKTRLGEVAVKVAQIGRTVKEKPEYEVMRQLAREYKVPLRSVIEAVERTYEEDEAE